WAPWRMEYISGEQPPGCLFCRVIEHPDDKDADLVVWRREGAVVMLNKFPYNPGHTMVAPEAHMPSLEVLDDAQSTLLIRALRKTIAVLRTTLEPEGFNIGVNIGRAAGAGIPDHVHFHIVPRWNGDTNFMAVIDDVKIVNESLQKTASKLKEAFAKS
ncbi:MAG: HIT domain-containing protein, partial [Candidatus Dormibacteraeota bacterium]|nr:HIT domain-containing protein [Candidatus Dormibacteraeota bacterium]